MIDALGYAFIGALLTGFSILMAFALTGRKPVAFTSCGASLNDSDKAKCSRADGHSGLHSVLYSGTRYWWEKEPR